MDSLKEQLEWTKTQAEEQLSLAKAASQNVSSETASQLASLESRLKGLKIVMSGTDEESKAYIATFATSAAASSNAASPTKSAGGRSAIGNAAPTPT